MHVGFVSGYHLNKRCLSTVNMYGMVSMNLINVITSYIQFE